MLEKLRNRIWSKIVNKIKSKSYYFMFYRCFWVAKYRKQENIDLHKTYFSAVPNSRAGIGHQMANWLAGYWFSKQLNLNFAHIPFSSLEWDTFLGFGDGEIKVKELISKGYKRVRLPLFDEYNKIEVEKIKKIIESYNSKKVVFIAEQDQFYKDQFGNIDEIKHKFYNAKSRQNDKLIFNTNEFNIAIHVRRGDIVIGQENNNPNLQMRWQNNNYFEKVLSSVLKELKTNKKVNIYLFSQGNKDNFLEFKKFKNLHFCLDMNAQDSFLHMVFADLLITSKSSFSYKPALLSNGIKVCPSNFWHGYPDNSDWILVNDVGEFENIPKILNNKVLNH